MLQYVTNVCDIKTLILLISWSLMFTSCICIIQLRRGVMLLSGDVLLSSSSLNKIHKLKKPSNKYPLQKIRHQKM